MRRFNIKNIIILIVLSMTFLGGCNEIETLNDPHILLCSIRADNTDSALLLEDKAIYRDFDNVSEYNAVSVADLYNYIESNSVDILHLFVKINSDGTIDGKSIPEIMEFLALKKLKLIIFARDVSSDTFDEAFGAEKTDSIEINFVVTLDRRGKNFRLFFGDLFSLMNDGESFISAWVELAPQSEGSWMDQQPSTIAVPNGGDFKFTH